MSHTETPDAATIERIVSARQNRRAFLRRSVALGLSVPALSALLAACGDDDPDVEDPGTVPDADDDDGETPEPDDDADPDDEAEPDDDDAPTGGTVQAAAAASPTALVLHYQPNWPTFQVVRHMFDALVGLNEDEEPLPSLVTEWEISDDGLLYTLHLRDDVNFHDGTHFDAEALKYNFDFQIDEPDVRGHTYLIDTAEVQRVEVIDDYTLEVELGTLDVFFLLWMTGWDMRPVSPTAREEMGEEFALQPVGSGPFMFSEYEPDSHLDLVRFDDYWGGTPRLDGVRYRIIPEASVHTLELQAGTIDVSLAVPIEDVQFLQDQGLNVEIRVVPSTTFVSMNLSREPTSELAVRRAIAHAIDRDLIIEQTLFGLGEKSRSGVATASPYYLDDTTQIEYDPEEAGRILDEAGWEMGASNVRERDGEPLHLQILSTDFGRYGLYNEIFQEQLRAIGIDSSIELHEWGAYLDRWRAEGEFDLTYMSFGSTWFTNWYAPGLRSDEYWHIHQLRLAEDPELVEVREQLDALIDEVREIQDPEERRQRWRAGQELVQEHQLTIWLWHEQGYAVAQPNLRDYRFAHRGFELHRAYLEQ